MILYISNFQIICDSFPFPIINNYILIIIILFIIGIVVLWLKIIVLLINVSYIITVTSIFTIILFIYIYYCSSGRYIYSCNDRHTRSSILLVFPIYFPLPTRSITWCWWLMWGKIIPQLFIDWYIFLTRTCYNLMGVC